jgi:transposase-like protein
MFFKFLIHFVSLFLTHSAYRTTGEKITEMLFELFSIKVSTEVVFKFKSDLSKVYKGTFEEIKQSIINGHLIQTDETRVSIQGISKYVWVFTNVDTVFYMFRSTRETDFLKDLLKEFRGVLISDFYTGYDSIPYN